MSASLVLSAPHRGPLSRAAGSDREAHLRAERWIFWYLALAPVWWAFGILSVLGVIGLVILFVRCPPRDPTIRTIVLLWFAVAQIQAFAVVINWAFLREASWLSLPYRLLNTGVTGWALLGLAIGVGAEYRLSSPRVIRGLCVFGLWILILGVGSYVAAHAFGMDNFWIRSPIGQLLPERFPAIRNYFTMNFFYSEPIFGTDVVRLILFFPWMNGLALAGITLVLACGADRSFFWRSIGVVSGLFALTASFSRSAFLALLVALGVVVWWRADRGTKLILVAVTVLAINALSLTGLTPDAAVAAAFEEFSSARSGSSEARQLAYAMSWEGFLFSPIIGHGWVGPIYSPEIPIPAGSHSSFYGLLYTGGLLTFGAFVVAFIGTLALAFSRSAETGSAAAGLGLLVALGIFAYGECLYSLVPTWLAGFIWLGGVLARDETGKEVAAVPVVSPVKGPEPRRKRQSLDWRTLGGQTAS